MVCVMCLFIFRLINKESILKIKIRRDNVGNCLIMFILILYIEIYYDKMFLIVYIIYVNNNMM